MSMPMTSARTGGLETKFVSLGDLEAARGGVIEGYASLFGEPDQSGDIVMPGAFQRSLERLAAQGRKVKFLWQHNPAEPIGVWTDLYEDDRGLWVKGEILGGVARGAEALALMAVGAIDGLSIGYRTVRAEKNAQGGRTLHEIELWEVSLVTFPMLPTARASLGEPRLTEDLVSALAEALSG